MTEPLPILEKTAKAILEDQKNLKLILINKNENGTNNNNNAGAEHKGHHHHK